MLLHRVEVGLLALAWHPLETVPKEISFTFCALFSRNLSSLVYVFLLKIWMRGHVITPRLSLFSVTIPVVVAAITLFIITIISPVVASSVAPSVIGRVS